MVHGNPHRVYAGASADGEWQVQVAEEMSSRRSFVPSLNLWLLGFFATSIVLLLLFNRWFLRTAFRAIEHSASQLVDRSPNDLRQVECDDPPSELEPLLDSINALFQRIERTLDSERNFTAHAAHELRTPLAAIRMQAQVAGRARSQQEAQVALKALLVCVDRAARMIDQLLTLARVEGALLKAATFMTVRLDRVVEQVAHDLRPALDAAGVQLELQLAPVDLAGVETGLLALVRNLVDNAIHHASDGKRVRVETIDRGREAVLIVDDAGPGIPPEDRERVFERFYRLPESGADGCGVGLSIVRCVAELHHATTAIEASPLGGLRVTVTFRKLGA
jgi:signal transduction histidine kinase